MYSHDSRLDAAPLELSPIAEPSNDSDPPADTQSEPSLVDTTPTKTNL